jgi:DNA-binding transcriptional ArsR family regulator
MRRGGDDVDELWAAVADPTRRRLLDALLAHGEATATTLAGDLPVTRQAVAKHLSVLERAGLGKRRRWLRCPQLDISASAGAFAKATLAPKERALK